jgi:hypothetical protein
MGFRSKRRNRDVFASHGTLSKLGFGSSLDHPNRAWEEKTAAKRGLQDFPNHNRKSRVNGHGEFHSLLQGFLSAIGYLDRQFGLVEFVLRCVE